MALMAQAAQLKCKLAEKSVGRPTSMMAKKMPSGASDLKELPRRAEFADGAAGDAEWAKRVDDSAEGFGKAQRSQTTSNEHDLYAWSFNEYAKRQGFGSFLERAAGGMLYASKVVECGA